MKKRKPYITGFLLLTAVEFFIGLFIHDDFIRPYIGDVIIVWVLYCLVRIVFPKKFNSCLLAVGILVFSFTVEFLQYIHIADILGLKNKFLRTLVGTSFAREDLWCYTAGTAVIFICIFLQRRKLKNEVQ